MNTVLIVVIADFFGDSRKEIAKQCPQHKDAPT
jgi:hypothetical protein